MKSLLWMPMMVTLSWMVSVGSAQTSIQDTLSAAVSAADAMEKQYADPFFTQTVTAIENDPSIWIPQMKQYLHDHTDMMSKFVVLDLLKESEISPYDMVNHLLPTIDYADPEDVRAASLLARRVLPILLTGPDYSVYTSYLSGNSDQAQVDSLLRWLMTEPVFHLIDDVSARMLAEHQQMQRDREVVLAFHEIEDSAWRASRVYIPSDTMTPTASAALDAMLAAPEWWVRLAAVEVMKDYDYMATPARKAAACADAHPVVSAQAQALCD